MSAIGIRKVLDFYEEEFSVRVDPNDSSRTGLGDR